MINRDVVDSRTPGDGGRAGHVVSGKGDLVIACAAVGREAAADVHTVQADNIIVVAGQHVHAASHVGARDRQVIDTRAPIERQASAHVDLVVDGNGVAVDAIVVLIVAVVFILIVIVI